MGKTYDEIDEGLRAFIEAQHLFFVATAPLSAEGHVNVSPKGLDTLRVLDSRTVVYLDYIGSGAETLAHIRENGRIVLMFCAVQGSPKIVRLHGRACAIEPGDPEFADLHLLFPEGPPPRAIIRVSVERCSGSCGFGVPLFQYEGERTHLSDWAARKGPEGLVQYQRDKNRRSIDDLPALRWTDA